MIKVFRARPMKPLMLMIIVPFCACSQLQEVKQIGKDTYVVSVKNSALVEHPSDNIVMVSQQAEKICPNGYEKLSDKVQKKPSHYLYTWTIKCIDR